MEYISIRGTKHWKTAITLSALTLIPFLYLHSDILLSLVNWWWTTSKYGHSLIIFPAIAYLIFDQRKILATSIIRPDFIALVPLSAATFLISLFNYIDVQILTETLFVLVIPLVLWAIMGRTVLSVIAMPLILLITVTPIWELVAPLLTNITADVAHISLNVLGVPVFKDEMYLTIPEGVFLIAEGCGGFRYFISGLSLGLIFAHLNYNSLSQRTVIVLMAVILSIVSNWIRVMIVIWAGHITDMQHPYVKAHVNLGWYVFAAAFFLYFFICNRFTPYKEPKKNPKNAKTQTLKNTSSSNIILGLMILLALLAPKFIIDKLSQTHKESTPLYHFEAIPEWENPDLNNSDWRPQFNGAKQSQLASYTKEELTVEIFYALYLEQTQDSELINYRNSITNTEWMDFKPKNAQLSISPDINYSVKKIRTKTSLGERTIWMWYNIGGLETADRRFAKLFELKKVFSDKKHSLIFAVSVKHNKIDIETLSSIEELVGELYPKIVNHFEANEIELQSKNTL